MFVRVWRPDGERPERHYLHDEADLSKLRERVSDWKNAMELPTAHFLIRLRIYHPTEGLAVTAEPSVIVDVDGNEYVDDFDLFLGQFDTNADGWVVYDQLLANDVANRPFPASSRSRASRWETTRKPLRR